MSSIGRFLLHPAASPCKLRVLGDIVTTSKPSCIRKCEALYFSSNSLSRWRRARLRRRIVYNKEEPATRLESSVSNSPSLSSSLPSNLSPNTDIPGDSDVMYGYYGPSRRQTSLGLGHNNNDVDIHATTSPKIIARIRVRSAHIAQTIDVAAAYTLFSNDYASMKLVPDVRHQFGKTGVVIELAPPVADHINSSNIVSSVENNNNNNNINAASKQPRFVAIYRFGSVVFFNITSKESNHILHELHKHCLSTNLPPGLEKKETFEVAISPDMDASHQYVTGDFATIKEFNLDSVTVIANIMAQTVALDSYALIVDKLLETFASINTSVQQTGNFTNMERDALFKVIAQNNSILIDMIGKLGIKDKSDTAWNLSQYDHVHQGMKYEFEIESRFEQIEFKLNLILNNAKFFLELLHNQKTNTLEWIIIVLITFECALMVLDMSGLGVSLLSN